MTWQPTPTVVGHYWWRPTSIEIELASPGLYPIIVHIPEVLLEAFADEAAIGWFAGPLVPPAFEAPCP